MAATAEAAALAERKRLEEELRSVKAAAAERTERVAAIKREQVQAERSREQAYEGLARGLPDAQKDVDKAEKQRATLLERLDRESAVGQGIVSAKRNVEEELAAVLRDCLDVYAEQADERTQAAVDAFRALQGPYEKACRAWKEATEEWSPLLPAVRDAILQEDNEAGVWRAGSAVSRGVKVPDCPLPDPALVLAQVVNGDVVPRPSALRLVKPDDEDLG
jgi:hypothetical protein